MPIYEVESWKIKPGKEKEHADAIRNWMKWVNEHRELFPEWKSLQYIEKTIAGEETDRHVMIWEYENIAAFEQYKERRKDYDGPYAEYKKVDPYHMGVFDTNSMKLEVWKILNQDLWLEREK